MNHVKRDIAEFGNDEKNGGIRISVGIGDGLSPKGTARTIRYTVGGTASRGSGKDYTIDGCTSSTCTVRLPANRHSAQIIIYVNDDGLDENPNPETIVFTLQDGTGYTVNNNKKTTTIKITDNDTRGLTFHRKWGGIDEGDSATHTLKLSSQPTAAVTVNISSDNTDVTVSPSSLTFNPSGAKSTLWSTARTVTISVAQDSDAVDDMATLTYTTSGGDYGGTNALSIDRPVSIDDDDIGTTTPGQPSVSFASGSSSAAENAGTRNVRINLTQAAPSGGLTLNYSVTGTATAGSGNDFTIQNSGTLSVAAGVTTATIPVAINDDSANENAETVILTLTGGSGYTLSSPTVYTLTITDNDGTGQPAVSFASASSSAAESAGTRNVTVNLSAAAPSGGLTLNYSVIGTATAGSGNDFTIQNSGTLSVAAGATSADIPVAINDDSANENAETVILTLTGGTGYTLGSRRVHTLTITDNDNLAPDNTDPQVTSITRHIPSTSPTDADRLTWRITFDEVVTNVNAADFTVSGAGIGDVTVAVTKVSGSIYDVTASGGNLAGLNGTVILRFQSSHDIQDTSGNMLAASPIPGTNHNVYVLDNTDRTAPRIESIRIVHRPTEDNPELTWRVTFNEAVENVDASDFTVSGTTALFAVAPVGNAGTTYEVTVSGGDLLEVDKVTLSFDNGQDIRDTSSNNNALVNTTPTGINQHTYRAANPRVAELTSDWLVRFGRTVAEQGLDSIAQRLRAPRTAGAEVSLGGLGLDLGTAGLSRQEDRSQMLDAFGDRQSLHDVQDPDAPAPSRSLRGAFREVLTGSHFLRVGETDASGGNLAFWGEAATSSFDGKENDLSLDGESTAVMLGADYARQAWLAGMILSHSQGEGGYRDPQSTPGDVETSLTTLIPWGAYQATETLEYWGALGVGQGDMELKPEGSDRLSTDIDWTMAAAGVRSDLISSPENPGLSLTLVGDGLWTRTDADRIEGLSVSSSEVTRLRLGLEGEYGRVLETGAEVTPRLEVGVRQDEGDAETGTGFEFGGGLAWRDSSRGLKLELAGRTLMAHDSDDLEEEGFSVSLNYDPRPDTARGLSLSVHQEVGARSTGGLDSLFASGPRSESADDELENRVRLEAAYGQPVFSGSFIAGPRADFIHSNTARDYSLGWRLTTPRRSDLSVDIKALYRDHDGKDPEHAAVFEMITHW